MSSKLQQLKGDDQEQWKAYWTAQGTPWRTEPEIDAKRQALLAEKREIAADPARGRYPFRGFKVTRADVEWLLATHQSDGLIGPVLIGGEQQGRRSGVDLRGADLSGDVNLSFLPLARARFGTSLSTENLIGGGKGSRWDLLICATALLLAMEFLIAIPTPFVPFTPDLLTYLGVTILLPVIYPLLYFGISRSRAGFAVKVVDYLVLAWAPVIVLDICLIAFFVLDVLTDKRGYQLASIIVLLVAPAIVGPYLGYRVWRAWRLQIYERRYRLIRQSGANLSGCQLEGARLEEAILGGATVTSGSLKGARLEAANLDLANCRGTDLRDIAVSGETSLKLTEFGTAADERKAKAIRWPTIGVPAVVGAIAGAIVGGIVGRVYYDDSVSGIILGGFAGLYVAVVVGTLIRSAYVRVATAIGGFDWSQVDIAQIKWDGVTALGDESYADNDDVFALSEVIKFYRALAGQLREAGFITAADRLTYRSLIVQRKISLRESGLVPFLGSYALDLLSGYGYRLGNIFVAYGLVVSAFAALYLLPSFLAGHVLTFQNAADALQISLNAIHGRVFFAQFHLDTLQSWLATMESIVGIVIEGIFVAMLIQRFFAR
jgi:uncharacterized protein YjbI with pentapeptide repeats